MHGGSLREVVQRVIKLLRGAYGMVIMDSNDPRCWWLHVQVAHW